MTRLLAACLLAVVLAGMLLAPSGIYANEIVITSTTIDRTTLVTVTNQLDTPINSIKIWPDADILFESFKTEAGWLGEITDDAIVFTSQNPIKSQETVKFGVKTDKQNLGISWKALDGQDGQLGIGTAYATNVPPPDTPPPAITPPEQVRSPINADSTFRIIPEKPYIGSPIRVTGEKFGPSEDFDFYLNSDWLGSFATDANGSFMTTMEIPSDRAEERVDFKVKSKQGDEKQFSVRIQKLPERTDVDNIKLTIQGIPDTIHRADFLEIFGTGKPGGVISGEIEDPDGQIINSRTAEINSKGDWVIEPVVIPLDAPFGRYTAMITDGREILEKEWSVTSDKVILITPSRDRYELGETMVFSGTALANTPLEIIIRDPLRTEVFSDIYELDGTGEVKFEFPTTPTMRKGTYTVVAKQGADNEFIFTGLGQLPSIPVNFAFDKLNYKPGEVAVLSLVGKASDPVSLLILDPLDRPIENTTSITLGPDGKRTHLLPLIGYKSGVYTAVVSKGNTQNNQKFTVGLQTSATALEIRTTDSEYLPGKPILILGNTGDIKNVLLRLELVDPDGHVIRAKETFSDQNAKITETSFRIPSEATSGVWSIVAKSGSITSTAQIEVIATATEGIIINIIDRYDVPGTGERIQIEVLGVDGTTGIEIFSKDGQIVSESGPLTPAHGKVQLPWNIPSDLLAGIYTINATDARKNTASTTFEVN